MRLSVTPQVSRRRILALSAGLPVALSVACAPGSGTQGAGDGRPAGGKLVELRVHARAGSERDGYVKNVEAFNRQFEGKYRAIYEPIDGDLYQGQETHIAGGTIGDVHYAHQSNLKFQEYAVKGVAVPLDPFISKDKNFRLADWPQRAQEAMKIIDNKVFGLPVRGQVAWLFLYWNRDMLRKAGIPEPTPDWTLDDMVNHAKRLVGTVSGEFYPITHNQGGGYETVVANLRRFGGEFFEPSSGPGKKALLDQAPAIQTYRWFYENAKAGIFAPRAWAAPQFGQGQTAFYFGRLAGERGTVTNAVQGQFEWTFDVVPKGPTGRRGGFLSIDTQQINSASKDRDGAWELLKWLTNKESGVNLALQPEGSLTPGFRKDVYCDDRLLNDSRFPKSAMQANCDNIEQPDSYTYPHNYRLTQPGAIQEVLNKYINDIVDLKQEPTPALMRELTTEIQHILDMPPL